MGVLLRAKVLVLRANLDDSLYDSIKSCFAFFEKDVPHNASKIAIKLNLCSFRTPETGVVSHPYVTEQLLKSLRNKYRNAEIYLVEGNSSQADADLLFRYLGFEEMAKKYDANCVNISKDPKVTKFIDGYHLKKMKVAKTLANADFFISHPKLKTHSLCKMTCGLKNQFGCIPIRNRSRFHKVLDEVIVDVNLAFKPDFVLVDGIIAHGGMGPITGIPKRLGLLVAGADVVAVDCVCAKLLGLYPYFVGHIRKAARKKIGVMNFDVSGLKLENLRSNMDFNGWSRYAALLARWISGKID